MIDRQNAVIDVLFGQHKKRSIGCRDSPMAVKLLRDLS